MRSDLDNPTRVHHQNLICVFDGAQSMGDDERCSVLEKPGQTLLDQLLALAVEIAGGFVQD